MNLQLNARQISNKFEYDNTLLRSSKTLFHNLNWYQLQRTVIRFAITIECTPST